MTDWRADTGRRYPLPLIVNTPQGPKDISEWAKDQVFYRYWLEIRGGGQGWNARIFVPREILVTMEHGESYTAAEIGLTWLVNPQRNPLPSKFTFIVEDLTK